MDKLYSNIKKHPLLTALVLNGIFFAAAVIFCDQKYETADDFFEDAILSGAFEGRSDPHLLYSNIILGYLLNGLYVLIPGISFYFLFLVLLGFFAVTSVLWLILKQCKENNDTIIKLVICVIFLSFFTDDLYILPQFTKAATVAVTSGGLVFLEGIWNKTGIKIKSVICGLSLIIPGVLLRMSTIYIAAPFLLAAFIIEAFRNKKIVFSRLLMCMGAVLMAFALQYVNILVWDADPEYRIFRHMESYRPQITDSHKSYSFEDIKEPLAEIGIDFNDYVMISTWNFTDRSVFSEDTLVKYIEVINNREKERKTDISEIIQSITGSEYWEYSVLWGVIILTFICVAIYKKGSLLYCYPLLLSIILVIVFICYGRINYRAECSIFTSAAMVLGYHAGLSHNYRNTHLSLSIKHLLLFFTVAVFVAWHSLVYLPDNSYKKLDQEHYFGYVWNTMQNSGGYNPNKYSIRISSRRPCEELLSVIENDKDNYYLFDFNTFLFIGSYNHNPWKRLDSYYFRDNYFYTGGLTMMQFPGQSKVFMYNGIDPDNPFGSICNDNIRVVDNYFYDNKLTYLRQHYDENTDIKLIGEPDGFKIWKYCISK